MNRFARNVIVLSFFLAATITEGAHNSYAADTSFGAYTPVNVSDSQKAQIKDVSLRYQSTINPLLNQYGMELQSLERLIHADKADDEAIRAQVAKVSTIAADIAVKRSHFIHDLRAVLTQEQIQKFHQIENEKIGEKVDGFLLRMAGPNKKK